MPWQLLAASTPIQPVLSLCYCTTTIDFLPPSLWSFTLFALSTDYVSKKIKSLYSWFVIPITSHLLFPPGSNFCPVLPALPQLSSPPPPMTSIPPLCLFTVLCPPLNDHCGENTHLSLRKKKYKTPPESSLRMLRASTHSVELPQTGDIT